MLEKGLYLEKSAVVIPWGATAAVVSNVGSPQVIRDDPCSRIAWGPETIFGGMQTSVGAVLCGGQRLRELQIHPLWLTEHSDLQSHYSDVRDHLTRALGEPLESHGDPYASMPSYRWSEDRSFEVSLWLFDRFGEQLMLSVTYKGKLAKRKKEHKVEIKDIEETVVPAAKSKITTPVLKRTRKFWPTMRSFMRSPAFIFVVKFILIPVLVILTSLVFVHWSYQLPST